MYLILYKMVFKFPLQMKSVFQFLLLQLHVLTYLSIDLFVDPETQACSSRELLLIVSFPVVIKLVITSALLGNISHVPLQMN